MCVAQAINILEVRCPICWKIENHRIEKQMSFEHPAINRKLRTGPQFQP
ncbi:rCG48756 [Rattus norvegicus]|uniref:RCG48756 n=1 Tax=Rattus norvegicus TaxID=10116 RepID=A6IGW6_RAT|nr:rCG48756 [Rattus norvegicus]